MNKKSLQVFFENRNSSLRGHKIVRDHLKLAEHSSHCNQQISV